MTWPHFVFRVLGKRYREHPKPEETFVNTDEQKQEYIERLRAVADRLQAQYDVFTLPQRPHRRTQ